jgi:CHASE1-domain containing sensor protein
MAARISGNKIVSVAVAGTVAMVGLGAVYVPFFADRDKLRGLHEESAPPTSAMLAQEIKKLQQEGILKGDDHDDSDSNNTQQQQRPKAPGSMWKQFK